MEAWRDGQQIQTPQLKVSQCARRHAAAATAAHPAPSQSSTAFAWQSVWSTCNHALCFPASLMAGGALRMTALYDKVRWAARFHTALAPKAALAHVDTRSH